ncbi:3-oxoacyl-[acyl-carrier-protein] reductase [Niveomyces insectorum RCEF 264]|uniref:3-oxoacyl-[acyl-carrier-protein] reductase n=1 Tax=Niveomyces insectorum RCEF 264 TaxID=1081102 RepID=A0A167QGC0_9HYPO|nr:3-oxoacyl-[acyl-carrier-protein] reductase [Niveomyces insectorum RCEF 264]
MANQQLAGKVIAVTGAASGIGLAFAQLAAQRGAKLSLADVSKDGLDQAAAALRAAGLPADALLTMAVDVRQMDQVQAWTDATVQRFGRLDGAANMAGVIPKDIGLHTLAEQDLAQWDFVLGVNTTGLMHCLRAQTGVVADGGSIVNAASIAGVSGRAKNAAYAASKHAVVGLTRSACKEIGYRGVRVNCICPGTILTPMNKQAREIVTAGGAQQPPGILSHTQDIAMRRAGRPEEVAHLIAYLLSDESTYVSGTAICVDGGWMC